MRNWIIDMASSKSGDLLLARRSEDATPSKGMDSKFLYISLIVMCFSLIGCEKKITIDLNGKMQNENIKFECGSLTMNSYCVSRVYFYIEQSYKLSEHIYFHKDSLLVRHKNKNIVYEVRNEDNEIIEDRIITLNNNLKYKIYFHLNDPLPNKGDTIIIKDLGYLHCKETRVDIGDVYIIIK